MREQSLPEIPTAEQREAAGENYLRHYESTDQLLKAYDEGRITREDFLATLSARQTAANARETRSKEKLQEAQEEGLVDGLTGLYNEKGFRKEYAQYVERMKRAGESGVIAFVDVNGLKEVNDTNGHTKGNELLLKVSSVLTRVSRATDTAAVVTRPHGDEFIMILTNANQKGAVPWWNRVDKALQEEFIETSMGREPIHVSVGTADIDPANAQQSLKLADTAMYAAKTEAKEVKKTEGKYRGNFYRQTTFENDVPKFVPPRIK